MKLFTSKTQKIGELGEKICVKYLKQSGYIIKERNFTTKEGEIDIIAQKENKLFFIEVKSIRQINNVSYETYNPAENMTKSKTTKCYKTISKYLENNMVSYETSYQLDLYIVFIDPENKNHKIKSIKNIINN